MRYRFLRYPDGKPKAVTFSYDDGVSFDIPLSEIFNRYGMKSTFNINSEFMGVDSTRLNAEQIKKHLIDKGHEIAVHGANHRANGRIRPIDGIQDALDCRKALEKTFGIIVRGMAYPDSGIFYIESENTYDNIKRYLTDLDIAYSRSLGSDNDLFLIPSDWHNWIPTAHHDNPEIMKYIDKFLSCNSEDTRGCGRTPHLLYIWGHSYEFDRNNNWEHIEDICKKLSGKNDIWYATNIEIYDYVTAYNSLIFSADGSIVHNPSAIKVWFDVDGVLYSVEAGKTIRI